MRAGECAQSAQVEAQIQAQIEAKLKLESARMKNDVLVLAYAGCTTCKNAIRWLDGHGVTYALRPIVEQPPTAPELERWVRASGLPVRKWLNTSGQSYRAIGKEKIDAASDAELVAWLAKDGKLVKRPVLVRSKTGLQVLVGFKPEAYAEAFGAREA